MKLVMLINVEIFNNCWHFNIHQHEKDGTFMKLNNLNVCKRFFSRLMLFIAYGTPYAQKYLNTSAGLMMYPVVLGVYFLSESLSTTIVCEREQRRLPVHMRMLV